MFQRNLNPIPGRSFFLFGARGTGKTTWLQAKYPETSNLWIDLLDDETERRFKRRPSLLKSLLLERQKSGIKTAAVIVDEVQKAPKLLDLVHSLIQKKTEVQFVLTGSSARKLKRGAGNLLGGRANVYSLFPLTSHEIGESFDLQKALEWGTLPEPWQLSSDRERLGFLRSYCLTYLKEEILVEQLVRKIDPFRDFLEIAAQCSGKLLNFEKIARDVGVDHKTVQTYYSILEETYVGTMLRPFHRSRRKSALQQPKFYFFDTGVQRQLAGTLGVPLLPQTSLYGETFESWLINEIIHRCLYLEKDFRFSFFRSKHGPEIDLILTKGTRSIAIEIKSTETVDLQEVRSLEETSSAIPGKVELFYLSRDLISQKIGAVRCQPWKEFIEKIESL